MNFPLFEISRSGLDVEYRRVEVVAQNLANFHTTRTAEGGIYKPLALVSGPKTASHFARMLTAAGQAASSLRGVQVYGVEEIDAPSRRVHEPAHPHADKEGFVDYPGIDHVGEMARLVKALRIYEANVIAMNAARSMYAKAMEIGAR